jgi:hypothetical protein
VLDMTRGKWSRFLQQVRRIALVAALASFALLAATALAAPFATLTANPSKAGKGSTATLDVKPPKPNQNPRSITLRVVKGVAFDARAVAAKCSAQQANANKCPAKSRIGGGSTDVTVSSTSNPPLFPPTKGTVQVDLFLAPAPKAGDKAGVVAHFKVSQTGQEGHVTGRVTPINSGKFGLRTSFDNLDTALKPPAGTKGHIDHMHLTYGVHRTVNKNGKNVTYNLITNPSTCNSSWPYDITLGYRTSAAVVYSGSIKCTK